MSSENFASILFWLHPKANRDNCAIGQEKEGLPFISKWDENVLGVKPAYNDVMSKEQDWLSWKAQVETDYKNKKQIILTWLNNNGVDLDTLKKVMRE